MGILKPILREKGMLFNWNFQGETNQKTFQVRGMVIIFMVI